MNLSRERMAFIRGQVERGEPLDREAAEDLQGHNDHLTQLCEAKGRLLLKPEADGDLSYALIIAERRQLKAQNEALRKDAERYRWTSIEGNWVARMFGKWRAHVGEYGDASPTDWYATREEAIDAAMAHEATQPRNPA